METSLSIFMKVLLRQSFRNELRGISEASTVFDLPPPKCLAVAVGQVNMELAPFPPLDGMHAQTDLSFASLPLNFGFMALIRATVNIQASGTLTCL